MQEIDQKAGMARCSKAMLLQQLGDVCLFSYCVSGLRVASELALPGLIPAESSRIGDADIVIRSGDVPMELEGATASGPSWQLAGDRFLLAVPGIIRMVLIGGREMLFATESWVSAEEAAIFLSSTGFGILLHQRGRIVLHASAVRVQDSAVLFCGPSGAGKSTLAAALVDAGYDLVTDDFCGISIHADGTPWVEPDGRQLKLWQNSIERLSLADRQAAAVRPKIEKYYVEPRAATEAALPLAAVYVLREARPPHAPGIARPNIVDAGLMVRNNAYRPAMVRRMAQMGLYFQAAATISQRAGVFTLTREFNFKQFPVVIGWLEAHWRELGLLERAA
jgi:energy-coupling factor transporter ATP-binding protein EcfA2